MGRVGSNGAVALYSPWPRMPTLFLTARACTIPSLCLCRPIPVHIPMERKQALCSRSSTNQRGLGRAGLRLTPAPCRRAVLDRAGSVGQHSGFPVRLERWWGAGMGAGSVQQAAGSWPSRRPAFLRAGNPSHASCGVRGAPPPQAASAAGLDAAPGLQGPCSQGQERSGARGLWSSAWVQASS